MKPAKSCLIIIYSLFVLTSSAQDIKTLHQIDGNYWLVGVPTEDFEYYAAPQKEGKQRQSNWCWAACIQMVLNYDGLYITQEDIVRKIYGDLVDAPANESQVQYALSGWAPDVSGGMSKIVYEGAIMQARDISVNLTWNTPLVVGLINANGQGGHAYVITGMYFWAGQDNEPIPDKVILRDPWPGNISKQIISWEDFRRRFMFGAKVFVSK